MLWAELRRGSTTNMFPQTSQYIDDQHSHPGHGKGRFKSLPQPGSEQELRKSQVGHSLSDSPVYLTTTTQFCSSLPVRLVPVRNSHNLIHSHRKKTCQTINIFQLKSILVK